MQTFLFKLYTKTKQNQDFVIGQKTINAENQEMANKIFNRLDLPFHTFSTIQIIK